MKSRARDLLLTVVLCICASGRAGTNFVSREIRYEKPAVLVFDRFQLNDQIVAAHPELVEIFDAAAKGETDPKRFVPDLLTGDDVEVQNCRMTFEHGSIVLLIKSKVRFVAQRPSKLRIVGIFGGISHIIGSATSGGESDEMLIFEDAGGTLLWFPDYRAPSDLPSAVVWRLGSERLVHKDFRLISTLNAGGKVETLLDLDWSQITTNAPSPAFLRELQQVHPMSGNDLSRLFSALKLAKGGYYDINASGFTNAFPGPAFSAERPAIQEKAERIKFQLDGSFDDWKEYKSGWSGGITNRPFKVIAGGPMDTEGAVNITECDYCNDQKYLYIFLKFKPSLESRHKGLHPTGHVGKLYVGTQKEKLLTGTEEFARADFQVSIPYGCYSSTFDGKDSEGSYVSYRIRKRDLNAREFSMEIREETSRDEEGLVGHGKDGVELAIRLSDLRKKSGDRLVLTCIDGGFPMPHEHTFSVVLE
jgi:hypothetical protein